MRGRARSERHQRTPIPQCDETTLHPRALPGPSRAGYTDDPTGRLIDEDETWLAHDTHYLDVHTREPFEALERYGLAMRAANHASPNVYDFPVLCGWSVAALSKLPNVNNPQVHALELTPESGQMNWSVKYE